MNKLFFLYSFKINECLNFSSTDSEEKWNAVWAAFEDSFLWGEFNTIMLIILYDVSVAKLWTPLWVIKTV